MNRFACRALIAAFNQALGAWSSAAARYDLHDGPDRVGSEQRAFGSANDFDAIDIRHCKMSEIVSAAK